MTYATAMGLGLVALCAAAASAQSRDVPYAKAVDSILAEQNRSDGPGCAVGVSRDGQIEFARGYGLADLESGARIEPSTIFNIGSTSKQFVTFAIQLLADDGKLGLDDDIRRYVPEVPDFGTPITIRHLIHHTSGLRDYASLLAMTGWQGGDQFDEARVLSLVAGQRRLNFAPGTRYLYSNTGYVLLATIVSRVSGTSWESFAATRLFAPLGMTRSAVRDNPFAVVRGRALSYSPAGDGWRLNQPNHAIVGSTAVMTTVEDLARWTGNYWSPTVGNVALVGRMRTRGILVSGDTLQYASGLTIDTYRGVPRIQHGGSTGGYRAQLFQFPGDRVGIAVLCNASTAGPELLAQRIADRVVSGLGPIPNRTAESSAANAPSSAEAARLLGSYVDSIADGVFRIWQSGAQVLGGVSAAGNPVRLIGTDRIGVGSAVLRVERASDGRAAALVAGEGAAATRYVRAGPPVVDEARLAGYAGAYRSAELDRTWWIEVRGGSLWLLRRGVADVKLDPVFEHGFRAAGTVIRFELPASGAATALRASNGRANQVEFGRVPD